MEAKCINAPIEIGNRVWDDTDNDGIQDAGENGISGVVVTLYAADGTTVIATATTDTNGNYFFSSASATNTPSAKYGLSLNFNSNYVIGFPPTNGVKYLTAINSLTNDLVDSDANRTTGLLTITTGYAGENNHSYDAGYSTLPPCSLSVSCNATNTSCGLGNGSISTSVSGNTGAVTYLWSNGGTSASVTNLSAGTYTVTVTEGACTSTCSATILSSSVLPVSCTKTDVTSCTPVNGSATATATGVTYLWSNSATTSSINNLVSGTYTVTVTSTTTGCTAACQSIVGDNTTPPSVTCSKSDVTNCTAPNGSATATATGVTYVWSNGATTSTINNLIAGTYTVTVTSSTTSCKSTCEAVVGTSSILPSVDCSSTNVTNCTPANGSASATSTGVTYLWSNSATTANINNLMTGSYTVTVTSITSGCTATCVAVVASNIAPFSVLCEYSPNTNCAIANGNAVAATTEPNVTYLWSNGMTTNVANNLSAGTYTITVTSSSTGCTSTCQATIFNTFTYPTCDITINSQPSCANLNGGAMPQLQQCA
ncbi:MAG: SdrD B-like domain-containing protein [Saprospiraceae bacterium]